MVMIHVIPPPPPSPAEPPEFLYECPCTSAVDDVAVAITEIADLQAHIQTLAVQLRRRLHADDFKESSSEVALALDRVLTEAEIYASKDQVLHKRVLSSRVLRGHLETIEKEVRGAGLKGLCDAHVMELFSDCKCNEDAQLWWAGKELIKGKNLSDYVGFNEKTKIVVRLKPACPSS